MLNKIIVTNFKSIDRAELKLAPLTIFTGANSSGKSTILQALMLLIKYSVTANRYSMEELLRYLDHFPAIRNKIINAKKITIEAIDSNGIEHGIDLSSDEINNNSTLQYQFESIAEKDKPELFYLNANRLGAQDYVPLSERKVGIIGEYLFSHYEKIKREALPKELVKFEESSTLAYQLTQWLAFISGSDIELVTEKVGDRVQVSFNVKDIEANVSPFNLGAGISYIAKVLIICLMAKAGDLVLLENPEVQLHPKSQALLGVFLSFIASKGIQLIVETHCEHLINRIRLEVSNDEINSKSVVIHYKPSTRMPFETLLLDDNGHFVDSDENRLSFPSGFFDASVNTLLSLR
ncbi:TPA: AAA family ATPase [Aeromonas hydrophila]|uniref:AAA family ATPase n=1 Tax=Aeromonas hydrophila TaxID=644 RepID=A0AAD3YIV0_AERHY|nr:AAA family ATPase [Aeromonas hydrophila]